MLKSYNFGALAYEDRAGAQRALEEVCDLEGQGEVELKDAVVVNKGADGTVELEQSTELRPGTGALTGGTIGLLLGLAVGGPLGAAAVGAAGGAVAGLRDTGLSNRRLVELGEKLEAGQAALCVLIKEANWELLVERLRPLGGHLLEARLTDEAVAALEQARAQPQA